MPTLIRVFGFPRIFARVSGIRILRFFSIKSWTASGYHHTIAHHFASCCIHHPDTLIEVSRRRSSKPPIDARRKTVSTLVERACRSRNGEYFVKQGASRLFEQEIAAVLRPEHQRIPARGQRRNHNHQFRWVIDRNVGRIYLYLIAVLIEEIDAVFWAIA